VTSLVEVRSDGSQSRYVSTGVDCVLIRPVNEPLRTIGGYFVLSPEQAEDLVVALHHWLEDVER